MSALGLDPANRDVFSDWLLAEQQALEKLSSEPPLEETLKMEYYQKLVDLFAAE